LVKSQLGDTVSYKKENDGEWMLEEEARKRGITPSSRPTKNKKKATKKKKTKPEPPILRAEEEWKHLRDQELLEKHGIVREKLGATVYYQWASNPDEARRKEWLDSDQARAMNITPSTLPTKNKKPKKK
jgi:hypothetical protein